MDNGLFPQEADPTQGRDRGLRFMNNEWNGSITNGETFQLRWNDSLAVDTAELNLYKVFYPEHGLVMYGMVSNLTDCLTETTCDWTPNELEDNLYTLLLTTSQPESDPAWTFSPLWRLKPPPRHPFHWAAPVGIPIVVLLGVYAFGMLTYFLHRRRKKAQLERGEGGDPEDPAGRHPSVSSVVTVQTLEEPEGVEKPGVWLFTNTSATLSPTKKSTPKSDCLCHIREPDKARVDRTWDRRRSSVG